MYSNQCYIWRFWLIEWLILVLYIKPHWWLTIYMVQKVNCDYLQSKVEVEFGVPRASTTSCHMLQGSDYEFHSYKEWRALIMIQVKSTHTTLDTILLRLLFLGICPYYTARYYAQWHNNHQTNLCEYYLTKTQTSSVYLLWVCRYTTIILYLTSTSECTPTWNCTDWPEKVTTWFFNDDDVM